MSILTKFNSFFKSDDPITQNIESISYSFKSRLESIYDKYNVEIKKIDIENDKSSILYINLDSDDDIITLNLTIDKLKKTITTLYSCIPDSKDHQLSDNTFTETFDLVDIKDIEKRFLLITRTLKKNVSDKILLDNFRDEYPIEDIQDYLYELQDEYGKYEVTELRGYGFGYEITFVDSITTDNYTSDNTISDFTVTNETIKLLNEINRITNIFNKKGLTLKLDFESLLYDNLILRVEKLNNKND